MRLYALLVLAAAVLHARAASIPLENEKKIIDTVPENSDKTPENVSSEQELIDQANTIKDVENNLRAKPEDIPVEVIVEDVQPALKIEDEKKESEEINRPLPDLRNPGPPQRQEHETQNPEYYAPEQQIVLKLKQSITDAQDMLRQGLQGISDGIQNMLANNEPINTIQQSIQSLREGFTEQIIKLNGTIQQYLNTDEHPNTDEPVVEQTKASFTQIELGLNALRNDFNRGVKHLSDGVEIAASLKAENEKPTESTASSSTAAPAATSGIPFNQYIQNLQHVFGDSFRNISQSINSFTQNLPNPFNPPSSTASPPAGVQSDSQVPASTSAPSIWNAISNFGQNLPQPQPGQFLSGSGPFAQMSSQFINNVVALFQPNRTGSQPPQAAQPSKPAEQPAPTSQPAQAAAQPSEPAANSETPANSAEPAAVPQAEAVTPIGPIRQILQNNPITQGIAGAVQRLQNVNNPEKPRETEKIDGQNTNEVIKVDEQKPENESLKGHIHGGSGGGNGDNNSDNGSRVESSEIKKEDVPVKEVEKSESEEMKEDKPQEVDNKTE